MTTATLNLPAAPAPQAVDPVLARAQFFFDLELAELQATIPQAAPPSGIAKY